MNRTAIYARAACPNGAELNRQVQVLQGLNFERQGLRELIGLAERHEIDTVLMTDLTRIGRDALKVLAVLETLDKRGVKLLIQGGDTVAVDDNPLLKCLRRFTPHPSHEVVLASTAE